MAIKWITILDMLCLVLGSIGSGFILAEPTRLIGAVLIAVAAGIKAFQKSLEENNVTNTLKAMMKR